MNRSKKIQIAREIYEENLSVSGRRPTKYSGKKIVSSHRRQPPLIVLGVVIGIVLAYSAVSTSWQDPFSNPSQNESAMLVVQQAASQQSDTLQRNPVQNNTPHSSSQQNIQSHTNVRSESSAQSQQLAMLDVASQDGNKNIQLSVKDVETLKKIKIEDTLDQFFYSNNSMPQAPEPLAQSDINAYKAFASAKQSLAKLFGLGVRTIVIDPGHGGKDPGALGHKGSLEKDIALSIAKNLRDRLQRWDNFKVLMTRDSDTHVPLSKRVEYANSNNADLFISIHINSFHSRNVNFIETYYFGPNKDTKVLTLAEKENAHSDYVYAEFKGMIKMIGDTMKFQESKKLAAAVQNTLYTNLHKINSKASDHGIKPGPFVVLLGLDAPSILTEVASLTNIIEEQRLNKPEYRNKIAEFLEKGIVTYLNKGTSNEESLTTTAQASTASSKQSSIKPSIQSSTKPGDLGNASEEKEKLAQKETKH